MVKKISNKITLSSRIASKIDYKIYLLEVKNEDLNIQSQMTVLARWVVLPGTKLNFRQSGLPILSQRDSSIGLVGVETRDHLDALDDGAHRVAEGATCASVVANLKSDCFSNGFRTNTNMLI